MVIDFYPAHLIWKVYQGLDLLTLSAMLPSSHPQKKMFFVALYMVAIGQGGHKPCVQAFGADQFHGENPAESNAKSFWFTGLLHHMSIENKWSANRWLLLWLLPLLALYTSGGMLQ
ncbi:unnamed protein product [Amaranthus hypochondriacus]